MLFLVVICEFQTAVSGTVSINCPFTHTHLTQSVNSCESSCGWVDLCIIIFCKSCLPFNGFVSGVPANSDGGKKKVLLLKGKEREISQVSFLLLSSYRAWLLGLPFWYIWCSGLIFFLQWMWLVHILDVLKKKNKGTDKGKGCNWVMGIFHWIWWLVLVKIILFLFLISFSYLPCWSNHALAMLVGNDELYFHFISYFISTKILEYLTIHWTSMVLCITYPQCSCNCYYHFFPCFLSI